MYIQIINIVKIETGDFPGISRTAFKLFSSSMRETLV